MMDEMIKQFRDLYDSYRFDLFHYETHIWGTMQPSPILATHTLRYSLN